MAGSAWTNQVQNQVIVGGPNGRVLVYSGTAPATGNLIASIAGTASTDPYGNNYVAGDASYSATFATALNGGQVTWYSGSLAAGWTAVATATTHVVVPSGLVIQAPAIMDLTLTGGTAGISIGTIASPNVVNISGNVPAILTGVPGNEGVQETWHAMSPLQNSWANTAGNVATQYRAVASPPNTIEIIGTLAGTAATAAQFFTLPAGYHPASAQRFPAGGAAGSAGAPEVACDTSGNLSMTGIPALPVADNWFIHGFISLDA